MLAGNEMGVDHANKLSELISLVRGRHMRMDVTIQCNYFLFNKIKRRTVALNSILILEV